MAKQLVPIRVKITRGAKGNEWPNFNLIDPTLRKNLDWSIYIDKAGIGWHYDQLSGFGEVDSGNPDVDSMFVATCVPKDFALKALELFPDRITRLTEEEFEQFYNSRAHCHEEDEHLDTEVLQGIVARIQLEKEGVASQPSENLKRLRAEALDPNNPRPGIRFNKRRYWNRLKILAGLEIDET